MIKSFIYQRTIGLLLLAAVVGCTPKKDDPDPVPVETQCKLERVTYEDGFYGVYELDADGYVTKLTYHYTDEDGKPVQDPSSVFTYNSNGLLDKVSVPEQNYYEQFSYVNGALSKIEIFEENEKVYQYDVTTNADKIITGMVGTSFDEENYTDYSSTFTLDSEKRYTKLEGTYLGEVYLTVDYSDFVPAIKGYSSVLKGWPVDAAGYWYDYALNLPVNGNAPFKKEKTNYAYDDEGNFVGLNLVSDVTRTYQTNKENYVTTLKTEDAMNQQTYQINFDYSNCD